MLPNKIKDFLKKEPLSKTRHFSSPVIIIMSTSSKQAKSRGVLQFFMKVVQMEKLKLGVNYDLNNDIHYEYVKKIAQIRWRGRIKAFFFKFCLISLSFVMQNCLKNKRIIIDCLQASKGRLLRCKHQHPTITINLKLCLLKSNVRMEFILQLFEDNFVFIIVQLKKSKF